MKPIFEKIFIVTVSLALSLGIIYSTFQYGYKPNTSIPITVTNIPNHTISFASPDKQFKYFFEPKANTDIVWNPEWLQEPVTNHINRDTIHDDREFSFIKTVNTYRIITIGDSFTFGQFVKTPENYSSQLETMLNASVHCPNISKFEVLNLGVMGYDVTYSMERIKRRGLKYNPDLIIYLINAWNITSLNEQRIPLQEFFNTKGIPTFDIHNKEVNPAVVLAMEAVQNTFGMKHIFDTHASAIASLRMIYHGPILIVSRPFEQTLHSYITDLAQDHTLFYDNVLADILDRPDALLPDRHPNAHGHTLVAQKIQQAIHARILQNCTRIQ